VFSFHPVKIITTAEGGIAVTAHAGLARSMAMLRTHGIVRDLDLMESPDEGPWFYEQIALGYNYRLTELQAALGLSQLARIDAFIAARHRLRALYRGALEPLVRSGAIRVPPEDAPGAASALHLYPVRITAAGVSRRKVFEALRAANIGVNVHYLPIYWHPYYRRLGFERGLCPHAESYYEQAISLPMHPGLQDSQLQFVADQLALALGQA
jgi:dTDP-4-amino-4,6-dideoxygalactose transaminase